MRNSQHADNTHLAKGVTGATRRDSPATPVIGIGPEQIAHGTLVRNLLQAVEGPNVIQTVDRGTEASVQAEDLPVDECRQWQVVEQIREVLPNVGIAILAQALVVEAVHLCDLARLVVTAQDGDALAIANLQGHQKCHGLHGVVSTVHVVAHEQVVGVRRLAAYPEELHEVVKLTVDISAHCHRAFYLLHIGLLGENLLGL